MAIRLTTTARDAAMSGIGGFKAVFDSGTIEIYSGSVPASVGSTPAGTLLAVLTFGSTAFGSASSGTITANAITSDTSADATGTAGCFVMKNSGGTILCDGSVGTSGADINFDSVNFVATGTVSIGSFTFTLPSS
jgi:hypothetical protein